jgi:hypothetical protein
LVRVIESDRSDRLLPDIGELYFLHRNSVRKAVEIDAADRNQADPPKFGDGSMKVFFAVGFAATLFAVSPALATGACSTASKSKWQPKEALQRQLEGDGYLVRGIKVEGGCYEVYAVDRNGKRANMAYNAETLEKLSDPEAGEK